MSNRRSRTRRRNKKILGMSDTVFFTLTGILLFVILVFVSIMYVQHMQENRRIAEEKERINQQVEEIYKATNEEIGSTDNYKSDTIIRVSAVGDILCGTNLQRFGSNYDTVFEDISKYLKDSNLTLGTYETDTKGIKQDFASSVKKSGVDFVSLAHNHAMDFGQDGLNETNEYLKSIGMETIGVYAENPQDRVKIVEKRGCKIAILAYTYDNKKGGVNIYSEDLVKQDLEYANENAAISIVMMHWGNVNTNTVSSEQEKQAEFLIDNGADIIVGAHPSAVQKMDVKENKDGKQCFVAYSLGDYTADFENENANLQLILNFQIFVDKEGNASIYKVDYTPVYMIDRGSSFTENRFKILDMKAEIAKYNTEESQIDKKTYEKLVRGIDRLKSVIGR